MTISNATKPFCRATLRGIVCGEPVANWGERCKRHVENTTLILGLRESPSDAVRIASGYTCNNSPTVGCSTEKGREQAARLGGCELHPVDDAVAREVEHIAGQPLVGALPVSEGPAPKFKYVAIERTVMRGREWQATVCSHTMAKRIANALNIYKPNREGV